MGSIALEETNLERGVSEQSEFPSSVAGIDVSKLDDDALYWWRTSGLDLARMMEEAGFPDKTKNQFLTFYSSVICPLLKEKPQPGSMPTAVGWDGNPFEYSWEFKGTTKKSSVRFVLDLSEVRPPNKNCPMSVDTVEEVLKVLKDKSPLYDDHWVRLSGRPASRDDVFPGSLLEKYHLQAASAIIAKKSLKPNSEFSIVRLSGGQCIQMHRPRGKNS